MKTKDGYWLYEWEEETSMFDPVGKWVGGNDYYTRTYKMWIPNSITEDEDIDKYIEQHSDDPEAWEE